MPIKKESSTKKSATKDKPKQDDKVIYTLIKLGFLGSNQICWLAHKKRILWDRQEIYKGTEWYLSNQEQRNA